MAGTDSTTRLRVLAVGLVLAFGVLWVAPRYVLPVLHPALRRDRDAGALAPPPKPPDQGQWSFQRKQDGRPVSYDPCRTIHYVVRVGNGPLNGWSLVQEGVERLSRATGLQFVLDGPSDEVPQWDDVRDPARPVFIGWADDRETDIWSHGGDVVGIGGSEIVRRPDGVEVFSTGYVVLKPDNRLPPTFAVGETEGSVLLHELGHLVGLDHVGDDREMMHTRVSHFTGADYGPGDLRGLWELGASQGCR